MIKLNGVLDAQTEIVRQTASIIPFLVKTAVICGIGYYAYKKYTNRFVSLKEISKYPDARISLAQAKSKADSIAGSITWTGNSFNNVADNLSGLNYNDFIRVYNAFGQQTGTLLGGDLNLIEWIQNKFSEYEVEQLSSLLNGAFF